MNQKEIHQLVHQLPHFFYQGQKVIVDTGSSQSYGRIDEIVIDGEKLRLKSRFEGRLSSYMPSDVVALIGMDIIKDFDLIINTETHETEFMKKYCDELINYVEIDQFMSVVPTINVNIDGRAIDCLFDTGAHINYINSSMTKGKNPIETVRDFNPIIGEFETNLYDLDVVLRDINKTLKFGNLPGSAETVIFRSGNVNGIIGMNLFEGKKVLLSIRRGKICF